MEEQGARLAVTAFSHPRTSDSACPMETADSERLAFVLPQCHAAHPATSKPFVDTHC